MERVTVAELKARLSSYLREVRQGKSFTVVSRDIPVATLGPHVPEDADDLEVIPSDPNAPPLFGRVLGRPPADLPAAEARSAEAFEPRRSPRGEGGQ
jgi:prevent-host-death family protein